MCFFSGWCYVLYGKGLEQGFSTGGPRAKSGARHGKREKKKKKSSS